MTPGLVELYRKLRPLQIIPTPSNYSSSPSLTILTYNLLSQHHINSEVYPYCVAGVLRSAYRRTRILAELQAYAPIDIAAFQEVAQFEETWRPEWEKDAKMRAIYAAKEGGRDGIAILYNTLKFQLEHEETLSFAPLMTALEAVPNIAQILVFSQHPQQSKIIVSNTHLFWRPEFDCLRVLQAHRLRKRIEELKSLHPGCITVMCGDWNSDPMSAVYHLVTGQFDKITRTHWEDLVSSHNTLLNYPREASQKLFNQVIEDFKHWPQLTSAYSQYQSPADPATRGEPPYTSINAYIDTLDYIFIDTKMAHLAELLMLPVDEIVRGQTALPNEIYSSDHLALMAKFILENPTNKHSAEVASND